MVFQKHWVLLWIELSLSLHLYKLIKQPAVVCLHSRSAYCYYLLTFCFSFGTKEGISYNSKIQQTLRE